MMNELNFIMKWTHNENNSGKTEVKIKILEYNCNEWNMNQGI